MGLPRGLLVGKSGRDVNIASVPTRSLFYPGLAPWRRVHSRTRAAPAMVRTDETLAEIHTIPTVKRPDRDLRRIFARHPGFHRQRRAGHVRSCGVRVRWLCHLQYCVTTHADADRQPAKAPSRAAVSVLLRRRTKCRSHRVLGPGPGAAGLCRFARRSGVRPYRRDLRPSAPSYGRQSTRSPGFPRLTLELAPPLRRRFTHARRTPCVPCSNSPRSSNSS